ncbi:MAG: hypothetical protein KIT84_43795 [Labilithrix sp.]|nr:hypothetical protein [Labilithrix sp.]MCW5818003.1 hypothetical protein [Labilithrix sp.]
MTRSAAGALFAALLATGTAAAAEGDAAERERAKEAYDRGLDAYKHGEMQRAAEEFARADEYAPSAAALQAALDAAIDADDVALGAELLERSKREPAPPGLASSITAAHIKFNARAGKIRIACPKSSTCNAKIDDSPAPVDRVTWTGIGQRTVSIQVDGGAAQTKVVDVVADQTVEVAATKANQPLVTRPLSTATEDARPVKTSKESGGVSPVVVYAAGGVTLALAGLTAVLMVQTSSTHGDFESKGCARASTPECADLSDSGRSSQSAANVALAFTALAAITTGVIAIGFTSWKGNKKAAAPSLSFTF